MIVFCCVFHPAGPVSELPSCSFLRTNIMETGFERCPAGRHCFRRDHKEVVNMKKLFTLFLILCLAVIAAAAAAEEDIGYYPDDYPESKVYVNTWIAENNEWRIEVYGEDGGIKPMVIHRLGDNKEDIWEYATALSPDKTSLTAVPFGLHYRQDTVTGNWDEVWYEDGEAVFSIDENGKLLWKDLKEDAGKGLAFDAIGNFYGGRWMKGDTEVIFYDWYDGQYDIRC